MRLSPSRLIDSGFLDRALTPAPDPKRIQGLGARPFAHRGLHGPRAVENSRAAFRAAIARGHGIELDVQASADGHAFVFHDYELARLTGESGCIADLMSSDLEQIRLKGTAESVPSLAEVLALVAGRVPLLIEVKARGRSVSSFCLAVFRALEGYGGPVGVMSFNPEVGRWFSVHAPRIARGLVLTEQEKGRWRGAAERQLALWRARPDFLAYDIRDLPSRFAARARRRGIPVFTWTVRTGRQVQIAREHADQIIYETVR